MELGIGVRDWMKWVLWTLLLFSEASCLLSTHDEKEVLRFIEKSSKKSDISEECKRSLLKVDPYLRANDTSHRRPLYSQSFATGPSSKLHAQDQDRWIFKGIECIRSAGDKVVSKSSLSMHYCYGYSEKNPSGEVYSICIPTPCADDHQKLINLWKSLQTSKTHSLRVKDTLDFTNCIRSRYEKQWYKRFVPVADLVITISLFLLIGLATVYHFWKKIEPKSKAAEILICFSGIRNGRKLIQFPKDPQGTLTCVVGLRVGAMVWVVVGHAFMFSQVFVENVQDMKDDLTNGFWSQYINNFTLCVDVFFVLGGTVLSFSWFRKWLKNITEKEPTWRSLGYWLRFYRHRLVRLWPAYLFILASTTFRLSQKFHHPTWPGIDPGVQCPIYWWQNLLFINSLFDNRCMPWTWYIGTEFVFYVLSPIFLLSLRKSFKLGLLISIVTIVASSLGRAESMLRNNFPPAPMLFRQPEIFNPNFVQQHLEMYIKPQYRIGPYIVGILLGYYLACFQARPIPPRRSPLFVAVGWTLSLFAVFWAVFGFYPSIQGWDWPVYHVFFGSINRVVFAIALAWIIYACHTGIGEPINWLLSLKLFVPLSNLSYCVYLLHILTIILTFLTVDFPVWYDGKFIIYKHITVHLMISFACAMYFAVAVEYPAHNIERLFLHSSSKKNTLKAAPLLESEEKVKLKDPSQQSSSDKFC